MSFYENTLVTKQDLGKTELEKIKEKYNEIINNNSGKVIKIEEWGLLNLARKIKRYKSNIGNILKRCPISEYDVLNKFIKKLF